MSDFISENRLKDVIDFSVQVLWNGDEDKPFYKALLVSASQVELIGNEPFWGYAVVSMAEYNKLIDALNSTQQRFVAGRHNDAVFEYYVEIQSDSQVCHCSLGFDPSTIVTLEAMADVLAVTHQEPLLNIVSRIRSSL